MSSEDYKKAFIANHSRLVRKLTPFELIQATYAKNLITLAEKEEVESLATESQQNNKLLAIFHRRYYSDPDIFKKLLEVLKDINTEEGGYIDHVISALEDSVKNPPSFPASTDPFNEEDRARLRLNETTILTTLDIRQLLPDLISEGVISVDESESIDSTPDFQERNRKFLKFLTSRGSESYRRFVRVLLETEVYENLAHELMGVGESGPHQAIDDKKYVEDVLRKGHVPPPPQNYIKRPELIKDIRRQLRKLKETDSWVLVSGLPGYGKTVLAAESVRSASLLREVFIGGVYWLNVGRMTTSDGDINTAALLEKIQNFIVRMDRTKCYRPSNLESATDYLQSVMNDQYPQSLLILDDIWEAETAQIFAVRCRTMATSRNAYITNAIQTNHVYKVSVMEGFTIDEGKDLLSKATGLPVDELPSLASEIIRLCHGSPIALDIISAMLQRNAKDIGRWKSVVERLKKEQAGGLIMRRNRSGSTGTPDFNAQRRTSEFDRGKSKVTLNTSIALSEEYLPAEVRDCFHMLVVFEPDIVITTEVLATLWDEDEYFAEDNMLAIVGWSLAQKASSQKSPNGFLSFVIHDLIMDYLRATVPSNEQLQYHQQFVERYVEKCGGKFSQLTPDGYIHQNLLSHLVSARKFLLLGQLLADLQWLAACCCYWDPNSLLEAYKKYRNYIPSDYRDIAMELQLFLSSHLDVLGASNVSTQDVIQLALNTPSSDRLVEQAKEIAAGDKSTLWFEWCNRSVINRPTPFLQLQPHKTEDVRCCQYFDKGSKVLSCSNNQTKIWEASTGKVLESFAGHSDVITHCVINETGDLLVTSSDDKTCKVWEVPKNLVLTFTAHVDGVQCCDLSRDSQLVVSADIGSAVKVWSSRSGEIKNKWNHGDSGVTSCAFTPNGSAIIVANQDGLLALYNLDGLKVTSFAAVSTPTSPTSEFDLSLSHGPSRTSSTGTFTVRGTVFSKDGSLLAAAVGDCSAKVWSVHTSQCKYSFPHSSDVLCVDFSPDSKLLVTGCVSGTIKVWSLAEGTKGCPVLDLPLHIDWVTCVKFSPQGSNILSSSAKSIKFLENQKSEKYWKLYHRRLVTRFSPVEVGGDNEAKGYTPTVICYDTVKQKLEMCCGLKGETVQILATVPHHKPRSWDMSHDRTLVAVGYSNGMLQLLDVKKEKEVWLVERAHDKPVLDCYFSPDDSCIVTCEENVHKVWSSVNGTMLSWQPDCSDFRVKPCVFYNDSIRVASSTPGRVLVWDTTSGSKLFYCEGISDDPRESILCVNISGDNTKLIASATNGCIAVWEAESGKRLFTGSYTLPSAISPARSCSLNWNGSMAAVGYDNSTLKIYNIDNGSELVCDSSNTYGVWLISTQFSTDGQQIVTLSDSIQWWSIDGQKQKQFLLKSTFGKHLHFSPDFRLFVTIDNTGLLYILKLMNV